MLPNSSGVIGSANKDAWQWGIVTTKLQESNTTQKNGRPLGGRPTCLEKYMETQRLYKEAIEHQKEKITAGALRYNPQPPGQS